MGHGSSNFAKVGRRPPVAGRNPEGLSLQILEAPWSYPSSFEELGGSLTVFEGRPFLVPSDGCMVAWCVRGKMIDEECGGP